MQFRKDKNKMSKYEQKESMGNAFDVTEYRIQTKKQLKRP